MIDRIRSIAMGATAALVIGAGSAMAAVVGPTTVALGDNIADFGMVVPGDNNDFQYDASGDFRIREFSLTANGFTQGADISNLVIELSQNGSLVSSLTFSNVVVGQTLANAEEIFKGLVLADGDTFSVNVFEASAGANEEKVALTLVFEAVAVPVPAAGLLLLTALAGGGLVARRRRSAPAAA